MLKIQGSQRHLLARGRSTVVGAARPTPLPDLGSPPRCEERWEAGQQEKLAGGTSGRQEDCEFNGSLGFLPRPCLNLLPPKKEIWSSMLKENLISFLLAIEI
jgi:hypothetical protein